MSPETWTYIAQFGVPFMILVFVGLAFWKGLWPFFMHQYEAAQARAERAQSDFLLQLDKRDMVNQKQTEAIENLTDEVRNARRK